MIIRSKCPTVNNFRPSASQTALEHGFFPGYFIAGMSGHIAQFDDIFNQRKQFRLQDIQESTVVDQAGEVVLVGDLQATVGTINPLHRQLQGPPGQNGTGGRAIYIHVYQWSGLLFSFGFTLSRPLINKR